MYLHDPQMQKIVEAAKKLHVDGKILFVMLGEHCSVEVPELITALNKEQINFFGGQFPAVIYDDQKSSKGAVLKSYPVLGGPYLIKSMGNNNLELPEFIEFGSTGKKPVALILVDGMAANISSFLNMLFDKLARRVSYIGGGAGSLSLKQQPCLFTPAGFFQDAALVTFLDLECQLGVRHGWERIMGPLVATKTDKNKIYELNWQNAYEVYRDVVEGDSGQKFTSDNFFDLAKGYPFGMLREYSECVVRDPVALGSDSELICVGEVPENSVLDILKGKDSSLIAAARQAAEDCISAKKDNIEDCLVADCISRVLFLEDNFTLELIEVKQALAKINQELLPAGMLTLGEISSSGEKYLEFFNKTIVIGVFYDR